MAHAMAEHRARPMAGRCAAKLSLAIAVILSAFVSYEPAPYEIYMAALVAIWFLFGLRLTRNSGVLLAILICFNLGGLLTLTVVDHIHSGLTLYIAVSLFLALSSVFFTAVIEADQSRLRVIFAAWIAGALATAMLGILGYFGLIPGSEVFTRYGRAKGAFQDPNVFGPFLVLPACYLLQQILASGFAKALPRIAALAVLTLAIFLAFSRAAWGLYALSIGLLVFFMLLRERSAALRLRIIVTGLVGIGILVLTLLVALQFDQVAQLFETRAQFTQDYDTAQFGRFNRYWLGLLQAMESPLGIGPLVFGTIYGEDTHNIWLKALMDYGWLGFLSLLTLVVWTLVAGFKCLLRDRPWQPYFLCAYIVFFGHILIATFIDTDHWRHLYILLGILWGCIGLEQGVMRRKRGSALTRLFSGFNQ
jgi:O-antigen ligase